MHLEIKHIRDQIQENSVFPKIKFDVCLIGSTIERANPHTILWFAVEIGCDRATPLIIKKLSSKGIAMHA